MPMNAEIKAQWTAALRGGEYQQGQGLLNADGKLCCLGVLCEVAVKAGIVDARLDKDADITSYASKYDTLPPAVREWAGLPEDNKFGNPNNPTVKVGEDEISLAELNDGEGHADHPHSFAEIADLIDAQL